MVMPAIARKRIMRKNPLVPIKTIVAFALSAAFAWGASSSGRWLGFNDGTYVVSGEQAAEPAASPSASQSADPQFDPAASLPSDESNIRVSVTGAASKLYSVRPAGDGIRFHSLLRDNLIISLTSVSGKTVAVLFSGIVEPSISYDFPLMDKRLATGVYYCSMKSSKRTVSVRLVLTR